MSDYTFHALKPVQTDEAKSPAREVMDGAQQNMGMVPNMYRTMANLPALLGTYAHGYDLFRQQSGFSAPEQEVIFITISRENGCKYCVSAHSFLADIASGVPAEITDALRAGKTLPDAKLEALSRFTKVMFDTRGWPGKDDVAAFLKAGYEESHVLGIVLALSVKTISNYANHLFDTPLDKPFESRRWEG